MREVNTIDVVRIFGYNPGGMLTVGRTWSVGSEYRYGFNGKEDDSETYGGGNIYDYGFRIYNPRLGKFLSVDPIAKNYGMLTPYQFAHNQPIWAIDLDGLEAEISTEKNTYFIVLKNVDFSIILRKSNEYFTASLRNFSNSTDFSINAQLYDYADKWDYIKATTPQPVTDYTPQGYSVSDGKRIAGRSSSQTFYFAENSVGVQYSFGKGDVPAGSCFGIGGGTPIIINGLKYGESNVYTADAPKGLPLVGPPGAENEKYLLQRSNGVYTDQNNSAVGKTILGYNSKSGTWILVSQQNGKEGYSLDQIRDKLASMGYDNVIGFDGSTSSTLAKDGKILVSPDTRKNSTIPAGLNISVPSK